MFKNRLLNSVLFVTALTVLGALFGIYTSEYYQRSDQAGIPGLLWPDPKQLRPFATIDHHDQVFGLQQLQGKWSFLFFGYTHCPDICPLTMTTLNTTYPDLQQRAGEDLQIVFVSVDPDRDGSAKLREYMTYFNSEFIGLGGTREQVDSLARQIGIAYFLHEADEQGSYLVDHSASVFLIDPKGRLLAVFSAPHTPGDIQDRFQQIHEFYSQQS
ncbi:MAG: SCO family protein [Thiotrichales bacterium]|nr:SCO family protein [Thiotrichales bacterium]